MPESDDPTAKNDTLGILAKSYEALVEVLAGLAASERKDWALSMGYLLQRVRGGHFLKRLLHEINRYRTAGKIKDDYLTTEQSYTCLQQLLDFVDQDSPDEVRFSAMQAIFLTTATESLSSRDDHLPQQLQEIARGLSSADVLILSASYDVAQNTDWRATNTTGAPGATTSVWVEHVLQRTGLRFAEIVRLRERSLIEKNLLSRHLYDDGSGFRLTNNYRLTDLGFHLCRFIQAYDPGA
jgi:hypothetical protein